MRRALALVTFTLAALAPSAASGNDDVDLIPDAVLDSPPPAAPQTANAPPSAFQGRFFAEDAFSAWSAPRSVPVPYPPTLTSAWQNRSSVDVTLQYKPLSYLTLSLSDRINVFEQDGQKLVSDDTIRNDLREASVTWEPAAHTYLEIGRINVRNGTALGFNPTDFFKTRSLVGQASLDPSVIRQNRLGTFMVRAQSLWSGGSASVAYAPKLGTPAPLVDGSRLGIDPRFGATNGAHRVLCAIGFDLLDLSPQLLGYFELHRSKLGVSVSRPLGDAIVAYGEWAGGPENSVIERAYGVRANAQFRNDVAAGLSWTAASAVTFNAEYHFHEAGFGSAEWRNWFEGGSVPGAANALWLIRAYASDQQEPMARHQIFLRAAWPRAFVTKLDLSAFAFVSLIDGSTLTQLSASYYLSDSWTASAYFAANIGEGRSERGSFPQRFNTIVQLTHYL